MLKQLSAALFGAVLCVSGAGVSVAQTGQIWQRSDVDLATLLAYGFTIVDTNFFIMPSATDQSVEVIYLIKETNLFRCYTFEPQGQDAKHWCEKLNQER